MLHDAQLLLLDVNDEHDVLKEKAVALRETSPITFYNPEAFNKRIELQVVDVEKCHN